MSTIEYKSLQCTFTHRGLCQWYQRTQQRRLWFGKSLNMTKQTRQTKLPSSISVGVYSVSHNIYKSDDKGVMRCSTL